MLQKEIFAYYTGADIATASIAGFANDSNFKFRGLGIQSLEILKMPGRHPRKYFRCPPREPPGISLEKLRETYGISKYYDQQ